MAETEGGSALSVDNSPSLVSVLGEMYGDYRDSEPDDDAGAPPATDPEPAPSEGTPSSAPAGDPPAAADADAPAHTPASPAVPDSAEPSSLEIDPLEGSHPMPYTVNGEARQFDGITVLKDGGAIIDPDALAKVQQRLSERDHLFEKGQADYQETSALKSQLEALTTWTYTDKQGQPQKLTGEQGLYAHRLFAARNFEKARIFEETLKDPQRLFDLLAQDESGALVISPKEWASLEQRIENATLKLDQPVRQNLPKLTGVAPQTPPAPEASVESLALGTVDAIAQQLNVTGFTPEDKQFLAAQLPRYVRATTPEEQRLGHGSRIVDHAFTAVVQREAQRIQSTAKLASTASSAAQTNAARLAAASLGKRPGAPSAPRLSPSSEPARTREEDFDDFFSRQERAAAGALRAHVGGAR